MKKIIGMVLIISIFQLFTTFFSGAMLVQTCAEELKGRSPDLLLTQPSDIDPLREELEDEEDSLEEINEELEFITEQENETQERINYLKTVIKGLESDLQEGKKPKEDLQKQLDPAKEELDAEIIMLEEIRDEKGALEEMRKGIEVHIAELTARIQKAESTAVAVGKEAQQQTLAETSELAPVSAEKPESTKEGLEKQIRAAKKSLELELDALSGAEEELESLQEEIQEVTEEKVEAEAAINKLLARIKELEAALASIENKEKDQPSERSVK